MDKNMKHRFTAIQRLIPIFALLVLLVSLSACDETVTATATLPEGAAECGGDGGNFKCDGLSGHQIFLTNVPPGVTPYLLPIPPGDDDRLRNAEKDGTNCIITIVGDLAFYDKENNLVRTFDPAVKISYRFLEEQDRGNYDQCLVDFPETIDYVPVAFYDNKIWRPVDPYTKADDGTVSFEFTTWGDQQGGFGTKP
jgi:hypothetical protein